MLALRCGRKGIIKAHGDVADEEAPGLGHFEALGRAADQVVGFEWRQGFDLAPEIGGEINAESLGHRRIVQRKIAHDAHDCFTPELVFLA